MAAEEPGSSLRSGRLFCTIGRMNPPTAGHMRVIERLFEQASKVDGNVVIFISESSGGDKGKENPLLCPNKKIVLEKMIAKMIARNPLFKDVPFEVNCGNPVLSIFGYVARIRPAEVFIILGNEPEKVEMGESIRSGFFDAYVPKFKEGSDQDTIDAAIQLAREKTEKRRQTYGGITLQLEFMDRPPGSISATMVRQYVTSENKPQFKALYNGYLEDINQNRLFTNITEGLNRIKRNATSKVKSKRPSKTSKTNANNNRPKKRQTTKNSR